MKPKPTVIEKEKMRETNTNNKCKRNDHNWHVTNLKPFTRKCNKCNKEEVWNIEMQNDN